MLRSSTVTQIDAIKETAIPPALAEAWTSGGEHFPIFDAETLKEARAAFHGNTHVLLSMGYAARVTYVRHLYPIDVNAETIPCPECSHAGPSAYVPDVPAIMARFTAYDAASDSPTPRFVCPRCHSTIYLAQVKAVPPSTPTIARARLNRMVDGLFALDHLKAQATLIDSFPGDCANSAPFDGVHAELEPFDPNFVLDHAEMIPYRHVNLKCPLTLRLHGSPFHGRDIYKVL